MFTLPTSYFLTGLISTPHAGTRIVGQFRRVGISAKTKQTTRKWTGNALTYGQIAQSEVKFALLEALRTLGFWGLEIIESTMRAESPVGIYLLLLMIEQREAILASYHKIPEL
jgi:hypothetical protein